MYYHEVRYFASWLGRWASSDPAGLRDGLNLFAFVRSSPIGFVDPRGRNSEKAERIKSEYTKAANEKAVLDRQELPLREKVTKAQLTVYEHEYRISELEAEHLKGRVPGGSPYDRKLAQMKNNLEQARSNLRSAEGHLDDLMSKIRPANQRFDTLAKEASKAGLGFEVVEIRQSAEESAEAAEVAREASKAPKKGGGGGGSSGSGGGSSGGASPGGGAPSVTKPAGPAPTSTPAPAAPPGGKSLGAKAGSAALKGAGTAAFIVGVAEEGEDHLTTEKALVKTVIAGWVLRLVWRPAVVLGVGAAGAATPYYVYKTTTYTDRALSEGQAAADPASAQTGKPYRPPAATTFGAALGF